MTQNNNSINSFFGRIYCINLDRREDRWIECVARFKKYEMKVKRISAVDGDKIDMGGIVSNLKPAELGCLLSHISILEDVVKSGVGSALILEDDNEFLDDWLGKLALSINVLPPDWEMLYLGARHAVPPTEVDRYLYRVNSAYTTSSYAVTLEFVEKVLPLLRRLDKQVDLVYKELHPSIKAYATKPCLVWQRDGFSDIQSANSSFTQYFKAW